MFYPKVHFENSNYKQTEDIDLKRRFFLFSWVSQPLQLSDSWIWAGEAISSTKRGLDFSFPGNANIFWQVAVVFGSTRRRFRCRPELLCSTLHTLMFWFCRNTSRCLLTTLRVVKSFVRIWQVAYNEVQSLCCRCIAYCLRSPLSHGCAAVQVPDSSVGAILGRGGEILKNIISTCNCTIKLSEKGKWR